jgi:phenylacetate-CoA ligase
MDRVQITPALRPVDGGASVFRPAWSALAPWPSPWAGQHRHQICRDDDGPKEPVLCATSPTPVDGGGIAKRGLRDKIHLKKGIIGSERWGERCASAHRRGVGVEMYDILALTEFTARHWHQTASTSPHDYWDDISLL